MEIKITPLLEEYFNYLGAKRAMLLKSKDSIKTLAIGSSHGDFGFDPKYCPDSFNLCCRSQDLKHTYYLYEKVSAICPSLKNVVVFYSVFSSGSVMEMSPSEKEICVALNVLFKLDIEYEDAGLKVLCHHGKDIWGDNFSCELEGFNGFLPKFGKGVISEAYGATNRANDHLKFNARSDANIYLIRILLLAKRLGHKTFIVIPPVRSDYRAATGGDSTHLFKSLFEILDLNYDAELINCFDSNEFDDSQFADFDHLLPTGKGTKTLSTHIKKAIT